MNEPHSAQSPASEEQTQPILTHEKSLSKKIGQGSEASDILDQQLVMLGFQLITQLNTLIKTSKIHGRTNTALDKPVDTMLTLIQTLTHEKPVTIRLQNDFLFLGDSHLKVSAQQMLVISSVIDTMNQWKIGGLTFSASTSSKDLREFAALFAGLDPATKSIVDFRQELSALAVTSIQLEDPRMFTVRDTATETNPKLRQKAKSKAAYEKASDAAGRLTQAARDGGTLSFKQAKRAIQNIVDLMKADEPAMLGFTTLRCHDQYTQKHSVNVALLSIALANRAGYPKVELADWEAVLAHGFRHDDAERWLVAPSPRARFYAGISAHTRAWARAGRGERWHAADALAMALALQPEGAQELLERPLAVETAGQHARGATIVDWNRQTGAADNVAILMRYDQARFEAMMGRALAAS